MEETQNQSQEVVQETPQVEENKVSFPSVGQQKKSGGTKTLLIIGILVLVGILGYVIYRSASKGSQETMMAEPTPYENTAVQGEETAMQEPSPTPDSVDKTEIKIQVQNGTGISGEAAYLQNILKGLDYTDVAVANSADQSATDTKVSFATSVPASVVTEITNELKSVYENVVKTNTVSASYDIVIITGLKKGATPKPTATATPEATKSPTPSASPTATP